VKSEKAAHRGRFAQKTKKGDSSGLIPGRSQEFRKKGWIIWNASIKRGLIREKSKGEEAHPRSKNPGRIGGRSCQQRMGKRPNSSNGSHGRKNLKEMTRSRITLFKEERRVGGQEG